MPFHRIPLLLNLVWALFAAAHPVTSSNIEWVDCSKNAPSTLNLTGIDLAKLPSTLHCGKIGAPMIYAKPIDPGNNITLGLAMYRPTNPRGVIFLYATSARMIEEETADSHAPVTRAGLMMRRYLPGRSR
jgi:hypothetical protein